MKIYKYSPKSFYLRKKILEMFLILGLGKSFSHRQNKKQLKGKVAFTLITKSKINECDKNFSTTNSEMESSKMFVES